MAVSRIKRIDIIGLEKEKAAIMELLQGLSSVEIIKPEEPSFLPEADRLPKDINIIDLEEAISFLSSYAQEKKGLLKGMAFVKPSVGKARLKEVVSSFNYKDFFRELNLLRHQLKSLNQYKEKLTQEKHLLAPWEAFSVNLDQIRNTKTCGIILGVVNTKDLANMLADIEKSGLKVIAEAVSSDATNTHLSVIYLLDEFERMEAVLRQHHFNTVIFTPHPHNIKERLLEINAEEMIFDDQIKEIEYQVKGLGAERFSLMMIYDHFLNIQKRDEAHSSLAHQRYTFALSGWIKEKEFKILERRLKEVSGSVALFVSEPGGEDVPVDLENNKLIEPFEFITKIFGLPKYNELDPTPFLAPFFFLYFGLCVSDAGYGLMIVAMSVFVLTKFKLGPQALRFFRLFLFCGISTVIIGAVTGSWFGNLFDMMAESNSVFLPVKNFKDAIILLDPMKEPTKLLAIALSFGIVQVWFGIIVAAIGNIKNKRYLDILLDQVTMLVFFFGLTGIGMTFLALIDKASAPVFQCAAGIGALGLLLTQGRSEKGWGAKLFYGGYNLYGNLSGYLSDILSYSRLWALGLVTGVMAGTINLISVQFAQIFVSFIPFANKVAAVRIVCGGAIMLCIFIAGHMIAFFMNLLGAFVHPIRLQFVEFFSKFFKSGGRAFKPFKQETKYINIE